MKFFKVLIRASGLASALTGNATLVLVTFADHCGTWN